MAVAAPTLAVSPNEEQFTVTFEKGATQVTTVYQEQTVTEKVGPKETFPDGHYTPKHIWFLDPSDTTVKDDWDYILKYNDDWLVWSEVLYVDAKGVQTTVVSNKLRIHR
jgi:hypothetical protein